MEQPVAMAVFAVGPFERQERRIKWEKGGETPMAFHSLPGALAQVNEEFMLAELDNAIRYFTALFGAYPYSSYSAAIHPYGFGQGFATMLMLPSASYENKHTFSFIAHETAHQWWGNIVAWRSYRDQWLSEGFAEYSGILYAGRRDSARAQRELLDECRESLVEPPVTTTGIGAGRLNDVGPIALGHRLETSQTMGSYSALVYNKGALVLRMLHMLFIDPASGSGQPFFDMMTDFVNRFRGKAASTEDFRKVAGEHFSRTAAAKKSGQTNLDWFFNQWVYQTALPSYRFEYAIEDQPDGSAIIRGTLFQENAGEDWLMLLPLVVSFGENQIARANIGVLGLQSPVTLKLPRRPNKVELDPDRWVLSEKTTTRGR
jgi:aminopeptidase N